MKLHLLPLTLLAPLAMAVDPISPAGPEKIDTTLLSIPRSARPFPAPAELPSQSSLPDPLVDFSGRPMSTRAQWEDERAPELRRLFQYYMYGQMPPAEPIAAKVLREDKGALEGKATLREIEVLVPSLEKRVHLLLVVPNKRTAPVPVFLGINFNGNHALLDDPAIELPQTWVPKGRLGVGEDHKASDAGRGKEKDAWAVEQTIDRGYAFACFYHGDIAPDKNTPEEAAARPARGNQTATIAWWAWGFSRMIDYLVTDPDLDPKAIAIVGHSRNGKTALLAAAMDERVALAIPSQAGCGGTAPNRLPPELQNPPDGKLIHETVKRINTSFPHWFCGNFKAFNDATDKLPFDQHSLIALCAPRPVLLSNATEDQWANPAGQFEMLRAANPLYKLVAGDGLGSDKMPEVGTLLPSRLGYYIRSGKHSMTTPDWKVWLDYADAWLKKGRSAAAACCPDGSVPPSRTAMLVAKPRP